MNIFCPVVCNSTEAKTPLTMMGKVARETNSSTSWRDLGNAASGVATPCFLASWYMVGIELRRAGGRWRVTVLALSIARRGHNSAIATFPEDRKSTRLNSSHVE